MDYLTSTEESTTVNYSGGLVDSHSFLQPVIHPAEYNAFLSLMLSTIDVSQLCDNYFQYLAAKLPLTRISFAVEGELFKFGKNIKDGFTTRLRTSIDNHLPDHITSTINYAFTRNISSNEQHVLHEFHTHFCVPLAHALSYRQLQTRAIKDGLTGLHNRAEFDEQLGRSIAGFKRHRKSFGLLVVDLDNFKQVNDSLGHHAGDSALVNASQLLVNNLRDIDMAFRFGGDEFCCLLTEIDLVQLEIVALRICNAIANSEMLKALGVTASIGGTIVNQSDSPKTIFERADSGTYRVKSQGRNGVNISL